MVSMRTVALLFEMALGLCRHHQVLDEVGDSSGAERIVPRSDPEDERFPPWTRGVLRQRGDTVDFALLHQALPAAWVTVERCCRLLVPGTIRAAVDTTRVGDLREVVSPGEIS